MRAGIGGYTNLIESFDLGISAFWARTARLLSPPMSYRLLTGEGRGPIERPTSM